MLLRYMFNSLGVWFQAILFFFLKTNELKLLVLGGSGGVKSCQTCYCNVSWGCVNCHNLFPGKMGGKQEALKRKCPQPCDDWATTNTSLRNNVTYPHISFYLFGLQAVLVSSLITVFVLASCHSLLASSPCCMPSQYILSPLLWPWSINLISSSYTDLHNDQPHPSGMRLPTWFWLLLTWSS